MKKYLKIYYFFFQFALAKSSTFRFDFFTRILMDTSFYAASLGVFDLLFSHVTDLGGWTKKEVMVFLSIYFVIDALNMVFVSSGVWNFSKIVNRGELDYYLLRPISTMFFTCFREINFASVVNLAMATTLLVWKVKDLGVPFYLIQVLWIFLAVCFGFYFLFCLNILVMIPVFWTHSIEGTRGLFYNGLILSERPDGIYKGVTRIILLTILPYGLIASMPARLFLDKDPFPVLVHLLFAALGIGIVLNFAWKKGLKAYSSASS